MCCTSPAWSSSAAVVYGKKELASRISPRTVRITAAHVAVPSSKMTPGPAGLSGDSAGSVSLVLAVTAATVTGTDQPSPDRTALCPGSRAR
jgi:hypothetical protein